MIFGKYKTTKTILHQSSQTTENTIIYVKHTHAHAQMIKCGQSAWVTHVPALFVFYSFLLYTHTHTHTHTQCPENKHGFLYLLINNIVNY